MSYSEFTLSQLKKTFNLVINEETDLFPKVKDAEISDFLTETLKENISLAIAIDTEKARSEMIVTPVLIELRKIFDHQISLFSGVEFNVDKDNGLNGTCDFIITFSKEQFYITAPIISIVEAKNDNVKSGIAQCIAEMAAAKTFNEQEGNDIKTIFGIVTTGSIWKFLKLEEIAYVDTEEYHIRQVDRIMGILLRIVKLYVNEVN